MVRWGIYKRISRLQTLIFILFKNKTPNYTLQKSKFIIIAAMCHT